MRISNNYTTYPYLANKTVSAPSFRSCGIETIKHANLGMAGKGYVGKVRVLKANGQEAYLNVIKNVMCQNSETYILQENYGKVIGEITFKIKKAFDYDREQYPEDPSHVFVEYLRNYSNPNTPYYRQGLEEYKGVGTRLLQIAQRRSDESCCMGNIQLHTKDNSKPFYKKLGFEEIPRLFSYTNNNQMYLPPMAKEPLSKRYGGL